MNAVVQGTLGAAARAAGWRIPTPEISLLRHRDLWLGAALLVTLAAVAVAAAIVLQRDEVFAYADTTSHVIIARRVFDNGDTGLAQLGVHWLPLLHLLEIPFVVIDPLYRSGASGTIVSGGAALVTAFFTYRLAVLVGAQRSVAFVAVLMLIAAPSFLYVSVIPMVYGVVMAAATGSVYFLTRWAMGGGTGALLAAGLLCMAATLGHFDAWILAPLEFGVVLIVAWMRVFGRRRTEASLLLWGLAGFYGIALFFFMNIAIFGEPFAFLTPFPGSSSFQFIGAGGGGGPGAGGGFGGLVSPSGSTAEVLDQLSDYPQAAILLAGLPLAIGGAAGLVLYVWRWRRDATRLVPLLLLYPLVFYSAYAGLRGSIIRPAGETEAWVNLRYANTVYPALAFFLAVGLRWWIPRLIAATVALVVAFASINSGTVPAWQEARAELDTGGLRDAAEWLGPRAGDDTILIPVHHFLVDRFEIYTNLSSDSFVDANDTKPWRRAHKDPDNVDARWIVWMGDSGAPVVREEFRRAGFVQRCYSDKPAGQPIRIYALRSTRVERQSRGVNPRRICPGFGKGRPGEVDSATELKRQQRQNRRARRERRARLGLGAKSAKPQGGNRARAERPQGGRTENRNNVPKPTPGTRGQR